MRTIFIQTENTPNADVSIRSNQYLWMLTMEGLEILAKSTYIT